MSRNNFRTKRMCDIKSTCKEIGNQYIFLVTIIAAIIAQEIDDNDDLDNPEQLGPNLSGVIIESISTTGTLE